MTIKLLIYIITIILPFLPLKTTFLFSSSNVRKRVELRKIYWILAGGVLAFISVSTEMYTDIDIYTNVFDWTNAGKTNYDTLGWSLLCRLFYWLGLNYRGMIPIIIIMSVFIISRACRRIDVDEDKVISLMLIFPGLLNIIQLKFFLAYSIIIYAVTFLQRSGKKNVLKYLVGILLATLIHSASIFCLVYLLVILFERVNIQKSVFYTIIGVILVFMSLKLIPSLASRFLREQVIVRYFTGAVEVSTFSWIVEITLAWLLMIGITWLLIRSGKISVISQSNGENYGQHNTGILFISRSFTIVCLNGLILPLLLYDQNFHRFIEIEYMIGYELLIFCFRQKLINKKTNRYIIVCILITSIIYCISYFVPFDKVMPMFLLDGIVKIFR